MDARRNAGFSMMEVMVVVVIVGILMAVAIPNFTVWIQNTQIRTATEALVNGMQAARNEAIRRNACMQLELKNRTTYWVNPCASPDSDPPYIVRAHEEGSVNAVVVANPASSTIVSFSGLGRIMSPNPSDGSIPFDQLDVTNPTFSDPADMRALRIEVPPGGSIRMCDPSSSVIAGDPRRCN